MESNNGHRESSWSDVRRAWSRPQNETLRCLLINFILVSEVISGNMSGQEVPRNISYVHDLTVVAYSKDYGQKTLQESINQSTIHSFIHERLFK